MCTSRLVLNRLQRQVVKSAARASLPCVIRAAMPRLVDTTQTAPWYILGENLASFSLSQRRWLSNEPGKNQGEEEPKPDAPPAASEDASAEVDGTQEAEESVESEEAQPPAEPTREQVLEAQIKDLKDQLLRSYAEQENTRKIASRDVESAKQFAIKSFAKSLLDVSDNLTRAMEAVPVEARSDTENNAVLATLYEGIAMTNNNLMKAFEANGLVRFGQVGDAFDPNKHEALFEYVDPQKQPGTVGQVMKPGFFLHKRVLRPAEVGVVKEFVDKGMNT